MAKKILALDPALSCGWALGDMRGGPEGRIASGTWDLHNRRGERQDPGGPFVRLESLLDATLRRYGKPDLLALEDWFARGRYAIKVHVGLIVTAEAWAWRAGFIPLVRYSPARIKKTSGNGAASKDDMMRSADRYFRTKVESADEADALWLYQLAREQHRGIL